MASIPITAECTACGIVKPMKEFNRDSSKAYGYSNQCRACKYERDGRKVARTTTKEPITRHDADSFQNAESRHTELLERIDLLEKKIDKIMEDLGI